MDKLGARKLGARTEQQLAKPVETGAKPRNARGVAPYDWGTGGRRPPKLLCNFSRLSEAQSTGRGEWGEGTSPPNRLFS